MKLHIYDADSLILTYQHSISNKIKNMIYHHPPTSNFLNAQAGNWIRHTLRGITVPIIIIIRGSQQSDPYNSEYETHNGISYPPILFPAIKLKKAFVNCSQRWHQPACI